MPDSDASNITDGALTPAGYLSRAVHDDLRDALAASAAVVVEGPRGCGKTWTSKHFARSEVLFEQDTSARLAASVAPQTVLEGAAPRLLDEWQLAPDIWPHVRAACDAHPGLSGRFVLTGSATPPDDLTRHSGAGRISRVRMRPMSLLESGHSTGEVPLHGLLSGAACAASPSGIDVEGLVDVTCRGGWPRLLEQDAATAQRALRDYLNEVCRVDVSAVDSVHRDPEGVHRVIMSLARNVSTTVSITKLAAEAGSGGGLHRTTAAGYLSALQRLFVVEDLAHWRTHLRSRAALTTMPKRHFVDPSLAAAALRATPSRLLGDLVAFGFMFESLVVRDLRIYAQANDAVVSHYRDSDHLEADAIVEAGDGRWMALEVKLGSAQGIDDAARSLLRLADKVDTDRVGPPSRLAVITASGYSYDRPDGVAVVSVSALAP